MVIYNVTVNIEREVEKEWKKWMMEVHIPEVMETGIFSAYTFSRLLHEEQQGTTYTIQYFSKDFDSLQKYLDHHAPALQQDHTDRYEGKFVAFRSFMQVEKRG